MRALIGWMRLDTEMGYHWLPSPPVLPRADEEWSLGFRMRWVSDRWQSYPPRKIRDPEPIEQGGACACIGWPHCCLYALGRRDTEAMRRWMNLRNEAREPDRRREGGADMDPATSIDCSTARPDVG